MNSELAQIITLVGYGNLFLHEAEKLEIDFSAHSTFQYVSSVRFARYSSKLDQHGTEIAHDVSDWFIFLRSIGVSRLWNIAFAWDRKDIPEHALVAFADSVPRAIQADLPGGFELWYPQWKTGGQEKKPWIIEYRSLMFPNSHALPIAKLDLVKEQLRQTILRAEQFTRRSDVNASFWADRFTNALELLDSPNPNAPVHPDILPDLGFSLEARQILASAVRAYVFGGMGSWNDLGFEKPAIQSEYEKITTELYDAVKFSILLASNSFQKDR